MNSAADASALPSRGRTDNERGMPPHPDWAASGRQVKCVAGEGGDGDRIGGIFLSSSDIEIAGESGGGRAKDCRQ